MGVNSPPPSRLEYDQYRAVMEGTQPPPAEVVGKKLDAGKAPESILEEAQRLTHGPRRADYGPPIDDYERAAKLWSVVLGTEITAEQAALCMILVKVSRQVNRPKRDNMVDIAGYAWVTQDIIETKECRI